MRNNHQTRPDRDPEDRRDQGAQRSKQDRRDRKGGEPELGGVKAGWVDVSRSFFHAFALGREKALSEYFNYNGWNGQERREGPRRLEPESVQRAILALASETDRRERRERRNDSNLIRLSETASSPDRKGSPSPQW